MAGTGAGVVFEACRRAEVPREWLPAVGAWLWATWPALHRRLMPMMDLAFAETNPGPLKAVLDLVGPSAPDLLPPLVRPAASIEQALRAEVRALLAEFGEKP